MRRFKKCIVTGATGSGGSYLIEHILKKQKSISALIMVGNILLIQNLSKSKVFGIQRKK